MQNLYVISLVMLSFLLDIVLVGFLEILYHNPPITFDVLEAYQCDHETNILGYKFKHIPNKCGMFMIKVSFSQPGWHHGSKV